MEAVAISPRLSPMPPAPTADIYRVRVQGEVEGALTLNVFHYRINKTGATPTHAEFDSLMSALEQPGGFLDLLYPALHQAWTHELCLIDAPTYPSLATNTYTMVAKGGTAAGIRLANQSAVVIQKRTNWRGKHGRGRVSLPAVPQSFVTGTSLTNLAAHNNFASAMMTIQSDGTNAFTPGVLATLVQAGVLTHGWNDLAQTLVDVTLGTVRRRKPGVGK